MLTLPIKGKWYRMIVDGIKKEEYRDITPYYNSRFAKHEGKRISIILRNGYNKKAPSALCEITPIRKYGGKREWGADPSKLYWTLQIHDVKEMERETNG